MKIISTISNNLKRISILLTTIALFSTTTACINKVDSSSDIATSNNLVDNRPSDNGNTPSNDFQNEAIIKFQDNEDLFERVRIHIFPLLNEILSFSIYCDTSDNIFMIDETTNKKSIVDGEFEKSLTDLAAALKPMPLLVGCMKNESEGVEKISINFVLDNTAQTKGILFVEVDNGGEIAGSPASFSVWTHLNGNWYYYYK